MGVGRKSQNKKTDKETQSPVLKIFKDIMQKENTDPEKVTLLKDKRHREKRKKSYSESRSKSDQKSYDSSSTDVRKSKPTKITVQDIQEEGRFGNHVFQNEKRESWWLWGDNQTKKRRDADTCSCVSCALKKVLKSEYTCIGCLVLIFVISVVFIFMMVFKYPDPTCDLRRVERIKEKRQLTENYDYLMHTERNKYDSGVTNGANHEAYPNGYMSNERELGIIDYSFPTFRILNAILQQSSDQTPSSSCLILLQSIRNVGKQNQSNTKITFVKEASLEKRNILDDLKSGISGDLANALGNENIIVDQNSDRLREFYKKLVETDTQIRRLKEIITNNYYQNDKSYGERFKRSLHKRLNGRFGLNINRKGKVHNVDNKPIYNITWEAKDKRSVNNVTGLVISKEKILIHYKPNLHNTMQKSQKDKLNNPPLKSNHEISKAIKKSEHRTSSTNLKQENSKENERELKGNKKSKLFGNKLFDDFTTEKTAVDISSSGYFKHYDDFDMKNLLSPPFDISFNLSTFSTPSYKEIQKYTYKIGNRKLMQIDEDKEEVSYKDLNEVLNDDQQDHDDTDKEVERRKRDEQLYTLKHSNSDDVSSPYLYTVYPNWKGQMFLHDDELNAMIHQAAIQNLNIHVPVVNKDTTVERDRDEKVIGDTEYIEDYMDDKYHKMVKMAQAYSDYGVVYGKNENGNNNNNVNDKNDENGQNEKFKFFHDKQKFVTRLFRKFNRGAANGLLQDLGFELKSDKVPRENNFLFELGKHIKISNSPITSPDELKQSQLVYDKTTARPNQPIDTTRNIFITKKDTKTFTKHFRAGLRSLKSMDYDEGSDDNFKSLTNITSSLVSDVMSTMSNWFNTAVDWSGERLGDIKNILSSRISRQSNTTGIDNITSNTDYNHKLRVLMSADESFKLRKHFAMSENNETSKPLDDSEIQNASPVVLVKANASEEFATKKSDAANKTVVKRSASRVFWNDLYDGDEYGIRFEYEDGLRNKHCVNKSSKHKSKNWFKKKIQNISHKVLRPFKKPKKKAKTVKKVKKVQTTTCPSNKRPVRQSYDNEDNDIKKTFALLTANMKEVCQKAAKDIENSKHVGVREDSKEGAAATSLMQQLVRLMSELVDIQVQQKTCAKLPPDLRDFLEWLTVPTDENVVYNNLDMKPGLFEFANFQNNGRYEKSTDLTLDLPTYNEDTHQDDRTECLGIIRSVQDLIQRYEEMTDDDKSKITGVREYLENQLEFLNRKLSFDNNDNPYKTYDKRQIFHTPDRRHVWNHRSHGVDRINKFIKSFVKKHTKVTPNTYDGVTITKAKVGHEEKD